MSDPLNVDAFVQAPKLEMVDGARGAKASSTDSRGKIRRLTDRLLHALDVLDPTSFFNASPRTDSRVLLSILRSENPTPAELRRVLDALKRHGKLGEFLHVIRQDEFRDYLKAMEVPWDYIVMNWAPSAGDSSQVLAGFIVGVGKESAEIVVLVGTLIGAPFDEELAKDAGAFWEGIKQLIALVQEKGIAEVAKEQFDQMLNAFDDAIYERRFFAAGQKLGQFVAFVVPLLAALPGVAKGAFKLAKATLRLLDDLLEVSIGLLRRLGVELQKIYEGFSGALGPQFAMAGGIQGELITGGGAIMLSQGGDVFGKITRDAFMSQVRKRLGSGRRKGKRGDPLGEMTDAELREFFMGWIDSPKLSAKFGQRFAEELGGLVNDAMVELYLQLRKTGERLNPGQYGKRLHETFAKVARSFFSEADFAVHVERRIADFAEVPARIKNMKVREFLKGETGGFKADFLDGKVGDKIPDLVMKSDDTVLIWDLTTKANAAHAAKTRFYQKVFSEIKGAKVEFGELYYRDYRPNAA